MNKDQLRTHFKALLNRSDCGDDLADTFIDQSITRIQRTLRIPSMERTRSVRIIGALESVGLPPDFLEIIALHYDNTNLVRIPLSTFIEYRSTGEVGPPKYFTREGDRFLVYPVPTGGNLTISYYAEFEELVADRDNNVLTEIAPDLVTYGALGYAADYFMDERGQLFEQKFQGFMYELQTHADEAEISGAVQAILPSRYYIEE